MNALCRHTLLEYHGCDPAQLKRPHEVRAWMRAAVRAGGGTIVKAVFHAFNPYGVSGVLVITESHVTIHTWPEHGYAAVDIFSCNPKLDHGLIRRRIKEALAARKVTSRSFRRGVASG